MSDFKRSYIVRRGNGIHPVQVDCCSVSYSDGAVIFMDKDGLTICAFSSWQSVEVMSQISGMGNGWTLLGVEKK